MGTTIPPNLFYYPEISLYDIWENTRVGFNENNISWNEYKEA